MKKRIIYIRENMDLNTFLVSVRLRGAFWWPFDLRLNPEFQNWQMFFFFFKKKGSSSPSCRQNISISEAKRCPKVQTEIPKI